MTQQLQIKRAIQRDRSLRTLRMCDKYLGRICSANMRKATLEFLWDKYVTHADKLIERKERHP